MDYNFDSNSPIYMQIVNFIKKDIANEKLKMGEKLPSVREMGTKLKVNPNTMQRVYQELERQGITYTQRGMGTFIKEDKNMVESIKKEMAEETLSLFINGMKELGFNKEEILNILKNRLGEEIL